MHSKSNNSQTCSRGLLPIKGMLILILSLKLSIVPYEAGPECRGQHLPTYWCQTASQVSLSVGFLISRISLPTKIGTPRIKVISQYYATNAVDCRLMWQPHHFTTIGNQIFSFDPCLLTFHHIPIIIYTIICKCIIQETQ